ncbi:hypothetical protein T459_16762 [Capsicum annuum]|uniref:Alpha-1,2-Mannosidase n=1 Tax=Capsicum annuum TaxID=4072 RepID=A0A2G2Z9P2_CAPAN|nr:hypothetical protein T459_16762 [Capsicum annuum]
MDASVRRCERLALDGFRRGRPKKYWRENKTVSIFETTIRILGGLISAHLIASDYNTGMRIPSYDDELLHLAEDLAWRMLPAFDTPTGHHKCGKLPRMSSHWSWFLPKADELRDRASQMWRNWYRWKANSIIYLLIGHELKNSKYNERYARLKLTIPISFSRIQSIDHHLKGVQSQLPQLSIIMVYGINSVPSQLAPAQVALDYHYQPVWPRLIQLEAFLNSTWS